VFKLSKWYLDCVTGQGDASVAYTGEEIAGSTLGWRAANRVPAYSRHFLTHPPSAIMAVLQK